MNLVDPKDDYRAFVARGYDACGDRYNGMRGDDTSLLLNTLRGRLRPGARVLDLGCGGMPITRALAEEHDVVGIDISRAQIEQARTAATKMHLAIADMASVAFRPESFEAVVSFYAIFHTPRSGHGALFRRIHDWLQPGGVVLATLAMDDLAAYTEEFFGVEMYWSHYSMARYAELLADAGFRIITQDVIAHGYDGDARPEAHPLVLAERP